MPKAQFVIRKETGWEFPWAIYHKEGNCLDILGNYKTRKDARNAKPRASHRSPSL